MTKPKISVIIPIYNVAPYLERCMHSLRMQTLADLQIICIDDCSTDNSRAVLELMAIKDPRIEIYSTKKNSGPGVARNIGLKHVRGEYIGFVDPDDWVEHSWYEKLYNAAQVDGCQVVVGNMKSVLADGKKVKLKSEDGEFLFGARPWRCIYESKFIMDIGANFGDGYLAEDTVFELPVILNMQSAKIVRDAFYFHFENQMSLTRKRASDRQILDIINIYPKMWDMINGATVSWDAYRYIIEDRFLFLIDNFYYQVYDPDKQLLLARLIIDLYKKTKNADKFLVRDEILSDLLETQNIKKLMEYMDLRAKNVVYKYRLFGVVPFMRVYDRYRTRSVYLFGCLFYRRKFFWGRDKK